MTCPSCGALGEVLVRNGWNRDHTRQRFLCKECGRRFMEEGSSETVKGEKVRETVSTEGQVVALKSELTKMRRRLQDAQLYTFEENEIVERLGKLLPLLSFETVEFADSRLENQKGHVVMLLSDVHFGNYVDPTYLGGKGHYNTRIAKNRLTALFQEAIHFSKMHGDLNVLNIFCLGDLLHGEIHDDFILELGVLESMYDLMEILLGLIDGVRRSFSEVRLAGVVGNHGRNTQKKKFTTAVTGNYEWLFYKILQREVSEMNNVSFEVSNSIWHVEDVAGWKFLMQHGDLIRGTRWIDYGLSKNAQSMRRLGGSYDYSVCGHLHSPIKTLDFMDRQTWVNGSVVGGDHFSINCLAKATDPCQTLLFVTEEKGVISERLFWLQNIK